MKRGLYKTMVQVYQQGVVQAGSDSLILLGMFCQLEKKTILKIDSSLAGTPYIDLEAGNLHLTSTYQVSR